MQGTTYYTSLAAAITVAVAKPHLDVRLLRRGLGQLKHLKGSLRGRA